MNFELKNRKIFRICINSITGKITDSEKKKLEKWLTISQENQRMYNDIRDVWKKTEPSVLPDIPDIDNEWISMQNILKVKKDTSEKKNNLIFSIFRKISIALNNFFQGRQAVFVYSSAIVIVILGLFIGRNYFIFSALNEVKTLRGEKTFVTLSDGTKVHLNSESSIRCANRFTKNNRRIFLYGEAFFEVTKGNGNFIVISENAVTTVLGTKFNINTRNNNTRVVVKKGCVLVRSKNSKNEKIELNSGQMGLVSGTEILEKPKSVKIEKYLGWMENKLVFERKPVSEIIVELQRTYDTSIELIDSTLFDRTITATFDDLSLESVISSLCIALDSEYLKNDKTYIIK